MNKLVKGSIAGAAGIALRLGGAGTFALWQDNATVEAGSITSGALTLASTGGAWSAGTPATWVPGDSATYTEGFAIVATGDNLKATLTSTYSEVSANGVTAVSTIEVRDSNGDVVTPTSGVYQFTGSGTYTATVEVDVAFTADGQDNQGQTVPLGDVTVSLEQVASF